MTLLHAGEALRRYARGETYAQIVSEVFGGILPSYPEEHDRAGHIVNGARDLLDLCKEVYKSDDALSGGAARVERALQSIAFCDPREFVDEMTGNLVPLHELPKESAAAVKAIKIRRSTRKDDDTEIVEIQFWDKNSALTRLGEHYGVARRVEATGKNGGPIRHQVSWLDIMEDDD